MGPGVQPCCAVSCEDALVTEAASCSPPAGSSRSLKLSTLPCTRRYQHWRDTETEDVCTGAYEITSHL